MNLLTAPLDNVTFDDVVRFCEQRRPEGYTIEYKLDASAKHLQAVVAAMANTYGGLVIVGVEADGKTNLPKVPATGMDHSAELEDTLSRKIGDNIYPPVPAEIAVCPPVGGKTFALIRVRESEHAPHYVLPDNRCYVRANSVNTLGRIPDATLSQVEAMLNRRRKSEEFRDFLRARAEERLSNFYERGGRTLDGSLFKLWISPAFPRPGVHLVDRKEVGDVLRAIQVHAYNTSFPPTRGSQRLVQDGALRTSEDEYGLTHFEFGRFGTLFFAGTLGESREDGEPLVWVRLHAEMLDAALESTAKLFGRVEQVGLVQIGLTLLQVIGERAVHPSTNQPHRFNVLNLHERRNSWTVTVRREELLDPSTRRAHLVELVHEMSWAFGLEIAGDADLKTMLRPVG